jgi:hypothetical protein
MRESLKCETNTPEMGSRVRVAAKAHDALESHGFTAADDAAFQVDFEHGQWWVTCLPCGAQWSVNDAEGSGTVDGFDFEEVSAGDGFCEGGSL